MAKKTKIPAVKTSRIAVGRSNHYKLEPAATRTHYGEHRTLSGGQPYAYLTKRADDAWFVVSEWNGKKQGVVQQWSDGEWTFSKIESHEQTPSWLRARDRETPTTIYNLVSRLHSSTADRRRRRPSRRDLGSRCRARQHTRRTDLGTLTARARGPSRREACTRSRVAPSFGEQHYNTLAEAKTAAREAARMPLRWKHETVGDVTTYYSDGDYIIALSRS